MSSTFNINTLVRVKSTRVVSLSAAPQATAMYLIRYAYKGSASLQLDAHTH